MLYMGWGKRHGAAGASPEKAPGWSEDGAALLGGKAGRAGIVQPGEEKLWGDLIVALQDLEELQETCRETIYKRWRDRKRGTGSTLTESRVRWNITKEFLRVKVVRSWHRLPREAVAAPSLEVPKDRAWSNLGQWKVSLPMAGDGTGWALRSLSAQPIL
ncbi:hypothetical protein WISP_28124 [Willisornis vidua]|uniref:Uncharacterized protein n=1 Tax=Willisornis vidua TaxID=1566151 RepID=A0ABQ9DRM9_9PASS|nr:hypothetical protein WISP_28124 [Willisornis vidua]